LLIMLGRQPGSTAGAAGCGSAAGLPGILAFHPLIFFPFPGEPSLFLPPPRGHQAEGQPCASGGARPEHASAGYCGVSQTWMMDMPPAPHRPALSICIFCGSSLGSRPVYEEATRAAIRELVTRGHRIVYGGGRVGLMGVVADETLRNGGSITGVIPAALVQRELLHQGLTSVHIVSSMHERKLKMSELSDAFLALPGGAGTLEELFEQWTWVQLGLHGKPCGVLDVDGYYEPLRAMVSAMVDAGFLAPRHRASLIFGNTPSEILETITTFRSPTPKWQMAAEDRA